MTSTTENPNSGREDEQPDQEMQNTQSGDDSEEEADEDGDYDSDEESYDSEELEALELLSEQIKDVRQTNQKLKQLLMATISPSPDQSSSDLVSSLMAGRAAQKKGGKNQK